MDLLHWVREALLRLPGDPIPLPVPDSMLQQDADLTQQPLDVVEGVSTLRKELEALKSEQEQRWQLPEQQAATLLKARVHLFYTANCIVVDLVLGTSLAAASAASSHAANSMSASISFDVVSTKLH
eukprot:1159500-Pelagomonas_calceolata.AAC.11